MEITSFAAKYQAHFGEFPATFHDRSEFGKAILGEWKKLTDTIDPRDAGLLFEKAAELRYGNQKPLVKVFERALREIRETRRHGHQTKDGKCHACGDHEGIASGWLSVENQNGLGRTTVPCMCEKGQRIVSQLQDQKYFFSEKQRETVFNHVLEEKNNQPRRDELFFVRPIVTPDGKVSLEFPQWPPGKFHKKGKESLGVIFDVANRVNQRTLKELSKVDSAQFDDLAKAHRKKFDLKEPFNKEQRNQEKCPA